MAFWRLQVIKVLDLDSAKDTENRGPCCLEELGSFTEQEMLASLGFCEFIGLARP